MASGALSAPRATLDPRSGRTGSDTPTLKVTPWQ